MDAPWSVPAMWPGETAVIVGGGPSLDLDQVRRVGMARCADRCRVIAVNDAVWPCWWADWLHAGDLKWWHAYANAGAARYAGLKTTLAEGPPTAWGVRRVQDTGPAGFDPRADSCRNGKSSAYQAMHLAAHAGAARLVLLGIDMRPGDGRSRWHSGDLDGLGCDYGAVMAPMFDALAPALAERGVEVLNCSPGTALQTFPTARLDEVL